MITLLLVLALFGFLVYVLTTYIPMPPPFKAVIYAVAAVVLVLYLMAVFGINDVPIPRVR